MAAEKFLILGVGSFYGSNFARFVAEQGDEAYGLDRARFNINTLTSGRPKKWDFSGYDYIVNFISRSLVAESWDEPQWWYQTNAFATPMLFHQLKGIQFERFVHVSTPEVYGSNEQWVSEGHAFSPSTPYAVSRAAGDLALLMYRKVHNMPMVITRTANVYGDDQPEHRFIPVAFKTLRAGKKLLLDGGGTTERGWIHVRDACSGLYSVSKQGKLEDTYHIATERSYSILEVSRLICGILGLDAAQVLGERPDRVGKDLSYRLKSDRLRNLGWRDQISLEEGLERYAAGN